MARIDPDWWKRLFDEIYLITDARSVCDDALTCREVDFLEQVLKLDRSRPILDLCGGQGRHALELSRRGFHDVTVLDYSEFLINVGKEKAEAEGLNTRFLRKDARDTGLPSGKFMAVLIMAGSLGYFMEEAEDMRLLREAYRLLAPGGLLLLDLPDKEFLVENLTPLSWHEANDDIVVCRQRSRKKDVIQSREMVLSKQKGLIRDVTYCTRLYSIEKITGMLKSVGFTSVETRKAFVSRGKKEDYGCMTNRIAVIGAR